MMINSDMKTDELDHELLDELRRIKTIFDETSKNPKQKQHQF